MGWLLDMLQVYLMEAAVCKDTQQSFCTYMASKDVIKTGVDVKQPFDTGPDSCDGCNG